MTVAELSKKLNKLPSDASIIIVNNYDWTEGEYHTKGIQYDKKSNQVRILADYSRILE